jgi:ketopantoate reductase
MAQKILIVGAGANDALLLAKLKEEHGNDIVLVTPEEAKEQGLKMEDIANIPTFKITASPIIPVVEWAEYKTGKEQRRERRKKERMLNKRR